MHNYCRQCSRDFDTFPGLRSHWANSYSHAFCTLCNEHFDDRQELAEHNMNDHPTCDSCGLRFSGQEGLHQHNRQSHSDRYCVPCRRVFQNANNLDAHSSIHKPKNVRCPMRGCNLAFVSASALTLHLEAGTCNSGIDRHMINRYVVEHDHSNLITRKMITGGSNDIYNPPTYIASDRAWNGMAYECYLCHRDFRTLVSLNAHLASPRHSSPAQKLYKCPNGGCANEFNTLSGLVQHIERGSCGVRRFAAVQTAIDGLTNGFKTLTF